MTTDASIIATAIRPVLRRDIARAKRDLEEAEQLLGRRPVIKAKTARPFLEVIHLAERHFKQPLMEALTLGLDPRRLAEGWLARVTKAADRQALAYVKSLKPDSTLLQQTVEGIYGAGHVIGAAEAVDILKKGGVEPTTRELDAQVAQIDWSKWTPGDHEAAAALADLEGSACLQTLLDTSELRASNLADTQIEQIARILADAADEGEGVDELTAEIADYLGDAERAELIATTELNRAVTAYTLDTYGANGIDEFSVLVYDPCPICADQESNNPHALDEDAPPYHPRCRCAATPVLSK